MCCMGICDVSTSFFGPHLSIISTTISLMEIIMTSYPNHLNELWNDVHQDMGMDEGRGVGRGGL